MAQPETGTAVSSDRTGALVCAIGAGLAGYSVLVKLAAVPCFSASCGAVINSEYGSFLGIPVGLFGLLIWGALPWLPPRGVLAAKVALAGGSVIFILLQALVIQRFCPICLAHAAACFVIVFLPVPRGLASASVYAGLVMALAVAVGADHWNRAELRQRADEGSAPVKHDRLPESIPGLPWLSEDPLAGSRLVISLSCGQCQRILEEMLGGGSDGARVAPILFLSEDENRAVTRLVVAAVLSAPEPERVNAFAQVLLVLLEDPAILARDDAGTAGFLLGGLAPEMESSLEEADEVLATHAEALARLGIASTPAVVLNGVPAPYDRSVVLAKDK